ncbi:MAG: NADH-quinone oxidoreductase subunit H [SAR324 cluster bacterium]|nr:NADH-quinone oxidoreductase subunit H [SAR324 cluster bacterium]
MLELLINPYIQTILKVIFLIFLVVLPSAALLTLMERKWSALIQDRRGPGRANIGKFTFLGIFHILADGMKLALKEDFYPAGTNRFLFTIAPYFGFFSAVTLFALLPITSPLGNFTFQIVDVNIGILMILAYMSFSIYGAVLAGWSTDNKYGMLGAVRASAQMISYEVFLGVSLLGLLVVYNSLRISDIVAGQNEYWFNGLIPKWGILTQPIGFLIFFTAILAEMKRAPFDAPEGESEIVAGFFIEYSGMRFALFFLAEYISLVGMAMLISTLFLGSYHFPWLLDAGFKLGSLPLVELPQWLVVFLRFITFGGKVLFCCWLIISIRWSLPRFKFDQIMKLGWNRLMPLGILNLIITILVTLLF